MSYMNNLLNVACTWNQVTLNVTVPPSSVCWGSDHVSKWWCMSINSGSLENYDWGHCHGGCTHIFWLPHTCGQHRTWLQACRSGFCWSWKHPISAYIRSCSLIPQMRTFHKTSHSHQHALFSFNRMSLFPMFNDNSWPSWTASKFVFKRRMHNRNDNMLYQVPRAQMLKAKMSILINVLTKITTYSAVFGKEVLSKRNCCPIFKPPSDSQPTTMYGLTAEFQKHWGNSK